MEMKEKVIMFTAALVEMIVLVNLMQSMLNIVVVVLEQAQARCLWRAALHACASGTFDDEVGTTTPRIENPYLRL
jgi:hypothetical protein